MGVPSIVSDVFEIGKTEQSNVFGFFIQARERPTLDGFISCLDGRNSDG